MFAPCLDKVEKYVIIRVIKQSLLRLRISGERYVI